MVGLGIIYHTLFAELAAPMYDLWNKALDNRKRKTTAAAARINKLVDLPDWNARKGAQVLPGRT